MKSWLSTTSAFCAVVLSSITTRIPSRSDSSRRSEMSVIFLFRTRSAICSMTSGLVHLIGDLGDDDPLAAVVLDLGAGPRAHDHLAAARLVRLADPFGAEDVAAGREIGPLDVLPQGGEIHLGVVDQRDEPAHDLAQVVGRDVGRHPDRDPAGAVDEQVRNPRRQDGRLLQPVVVVGDVVDRVLVDVGQHLGRDRAPSAPRCTGRPPRSRRRSSRSSPARRRADSAARTAGPCGPSRRTPRCRRAGGTCPARLRPRSRSSCTAGRDRGRSPTSSTGCADGRASGRRARRAAPARR